MGGGDGGRLRQQDRDPIAASDAAGRQHIGEPIRSSFLLSDHSFIFLI